MQTNKHTAEDVRSQGSSAEVNQQSQGQGSGMQNEPQVCRICLGTEEEE